MSEKRRDNKGRILRTGESQRKDGKYEYKYTELDGERCSVYSWRLVPTDSLTKSKRQDLSLREKEDEITEHQNKNGNFRAAQIILADVIKKYLQIRKFAPSTYENYQYYLKKDIESSHLGRMKVIDIRKSDVKSFYAKMSKKGYKNGTIQILHKIIHPALEMLVDDNIISQNPARDSCKDYTVTEPREAMNPSEREIFYDEILKLFYSEEKYYLVFRVMQGLSCRISELIGLTWSDVDMERREVLIDHGLLYRKKDGKTQFYITKGNYKNRKRIIPMTDEVYLCFLKLLEKAKTNPSKCVIDGYSNFVYVNMRGGPMYPATLNKEIYKRIKQYNEEKGKEFPIISNHIFRHTGCTEMAEAEVDLGTMKYVMGHSNARMILKVYDSVNADRVQNQMKKLNKKPAEIEGVC